MLDIELRDAKLMQEFMDDWRRRVTDADERTADAEAKISVVKDEFGKVAESVMSRNVS